MNTASRVRVGVFGASGRVGKLVVSAVLAAPGFELAAAVVPESSSVLGAPVPGADARYVTLDSLGECDAVVDFSKPAAAMALLDSARASGLPLVIGTTGFDAGQTARILAAAARRPVVLAANFGRGFPTFLRLAIALAAAEPETLPRVAEIYHARKKAEASGTSRLLADAAASAGGHAAADIAIDVAREGETVGVNAVRVDLGPAEIEVRYTVKALASYAEGALAAARWAVGRAPGLYGLADIGAPAARGGTHDA